MIRNQVYVLAILLLFCGFSHAAVWSDTNTWTPEWESRFSQWVEAEWQVDFFSRKNLRNGQPNPYYGLTKDCADTVYSMRVIFAYEYNLPFVMNDPTGGTKLITNRMSQFDRYTNSTERIRRYLNYLDGLVSTRSIPADTYPIAINRNSVRPGTLILTTKINHHSWTIKQILPIGVPWLVYNSVAGAGTGPHLKERQSWPNPYWVFENGYNAASFAGFRDWKPIELINRPQWEIPGYSEEQYKVPLNRWNKWAQERLATRTEANSQRIQRLTKTACDGLTMRVDAINEGADYLRQNPNRCMDYATYDLYSTPNRDQRLFDDLMSLRQGYKDIILAHEQGTLDDMTNRQMAKLYPKIELSLRDELTQQSEPVLIDADSLCPVSYAPGRQMDLAEAKRRISLALFSNNPHDGVDYRWGGLEGHSPLARQCQSWDPWTPDLEQH